MRQDALTIDAGLVELDINGARKIVFNPSDSGFVEELYMLVSKLEAIQKAKREEMNSAGDDYVRCFDISRAEDREMRDEMDAQFGEGFCADVFPGIRLMALVDGLSVAEAFLYGLLDKMDADIMANYAARDARIKKYTEKYSKYAKKYHT